MEQTNCSTSNYASNDFDCQGSVVNVPFSWEYKPGLSKVAHHPHHHDLSNNGTRGGSNFVLQPPPSSSFATRSDKHVHLVQAPSPIISSFRMESTQKEEDPFVEAYKNCTKSPFMFLQRSTTTSTSRDKKDNNNGSSWPSIRKYMHILSCKYAGSGVSIGKPICTYKDVKVVEK